MPTATSRPEFGELQSLGLTAESDGSAANKAITDSEKTNQRYQDAAERLLKATIVVDEFLGTEKVERLVRTLQRIEGYSMEWRDATEEDLEQATGREFDVVGVNTWGKEGPRKGKGILRIGLTIVENPSSFREWPNSVSEEELINQHGYAAPLESLRWHYADETQ